MRNIGKISSSVEIITFSRLEFSHILGNFGWFWPKFIIFCLIPVSIFFRYWRQLNKQWRHPKARREMKHLKNLTYLWGRCWMKWQPKENSPVIFTERPSCLLNWLDSFIRGNWRHNTFSQCDGDFLSIFLRHGTRCAIDTNIHKKIAVAAGF